MFVWWGSKGLRVVDSQVHASVCNKNRKTHSWAGSVPWCEKTTSFCAVRYKTITGSEPLVRFENAGTGDIIAVASVRVG